MKSEVARQLAEQLEMVVSEYGEARKKSQYDDLSDLGSRFAFKLTAQARAGVERVTGRDSAYSRQIVEILAMRHTHDYDRLSMVIGVVESLIHDLKAGHILSLFELAHSEVFGDYLEMADYLLEEGFKDPAAVVAGGTLEAHLRQLCEKHGIPIEITTAKGRYAKKADQLNADLAGASAISKLDQKSVTAWLDLRNKAAHGKYTEYTQEQVVMLTAGIREFLTRNPA